MTDPQNYDWRNYEYLRRGEALDSACSYGSSAYGTAVVIAALVIVSYSGG